MSLDSPSDKNLTEELSTDDVVDLLGEEVKGEEKKEEEEREKHEHDGGKP